MVWSKLDDGILDHPKIAAAGPIGFGVFVAGLVYANRNLTDGFIPYGAARRLLGTTWTDDSPSASPDDSLHGPRVWTVASTCGMQGLDGQDAIEQAVATLVRLGLWSEVPHGYVIHDFLDWNRSRDKVLEEREKTAERVNKLRSKGEKSRNAVRNAVTNDVGTPSPVPVPEPVPEAVPEPQKLRSKLPPTAVVDNNPNQPTDRQLYFADRLGITIPAIVKLNKAFTRAAVLDAMSEVHGFVDRSQIQDSFAYLRSVLNARQETG